MSKKIGKNDLEKQSMKYGFKPNMICGSILMPYIFIFAGVPFKDLPISLLFGLCAMGTLQFFLAPITNKWITRKLTERIKEWENGELNLFERTELASEVIKVPLYVGIETFLEYLIGCAIWILVNRYILNFSVEITFYSICSCIFGSLLAGLFAIIENAKLSSRIAKDINADGIDTTFVNDRTSFGIPLKFQVIGFVMVPFVIAVLILFLQVCSLTEGIDNNALIRLGIIFAINMALCIVLASFFFKTLFLPISRMNQTLLEIKQKGASASELLETDLSDEISCTMMRINDTILQFRKVLDDAKSIGQAVLLATDNLAIMTNESSSTALEQASAVKEIVSTMEDSDKLTRNIAKKVGDVTDIAGKTTNDVIEGFASITSNLEKMKQITATNMETISGIKQLNEKIESIWEIVKIINDIADQTKIIAFNAELEASSAGEAGRNFHIVANEIRRLADNTMDSTKEIKERITEIQHSSDNLIITSESGTEKIQEGCDLSVKLEKNFENIKTSAEVTAGSSSEIKLIIDQETAAFDQILITLKQLSAGIDSSSITTQTVTTATASLREIADKLAILM